MNFEWYNSSDAFVMRKMDAPVVFPPHTMYDWKIMGGWGSDHVVLLVLELLKFVVFYRACA